MTLDEWVELHRTDLVAEVPDKRTIAELREVADRELQDADAVISSEGKLMHAHNACLAIAAAALAAEGYRLRRGTPDHHWRLIESLEFTLGLSPRQVRDFRSIGKSAVAQCTNARASSRVPRLTLLSPLPAVCALNSRSGLLRGTPTYGNREHGYRGLARVQPDRELPVEPSDPRREPEPGARRSLCPLTPPTPPIGREAGKREDRTAEC